MSEVKLNQREVAILNQDNVAERVGSYYVPIKTQDVLTVFKSYGFEMTRPPVITKTRKVENEGFQKHLTRLSNKDLIQVEGEIPEIVVVNSYNGLSSIKLMMGMYRLICSNGLIVGDTYESYSVAHKGNVLDNLSNAIAAIMEDHSGFLRDVSRMKDVTLSASQVESFGVEASKIILPENATLVNPSHVLGARRKEDAGVQLWQVFNRVQENLLGGGIQYNLPVPSDTQAGHLRQKSTRQVRSVDSNVNVNGQLWDLALSLVA